MLWFEREVVRSLANPELGEPERAAVEAYVDTTLRSMPEHLRLGVAAESVIFGAPWFAAHLVARRVLHRHAPGRPARGVARRVERWRTSRFDPLRQYVRLLQSLVLFAELELVPDAR